VRDYHAFFGEIPDEFFATCDFSAVKKTIFNFISGKILPLEQNILVQNFVRFPSKMRALALIRYDERFASFFITKTGQSLEVSINRYFNYF
jgi:hypothetical protein